jgi:nucleoside 2-deoxyribosyltransferase
MKAYIAAPIFTPQNLAVVGAIKELLEESGFDIFSPYDASQAIWNGRAPKDCSPEERAQVLDGNVANLFGVDLLVAWVGGREDKSTDNGVAWEMGFVNALRRDHDALEHGGEYNTIAYIHPDDVRQDMNLMLAGTVQAAVRGLDDLRAALRAYKLGGIGGILPRFHPDNLIAHEKEPIV